MKKVPHSFNKRILRKEEMVNPKNPHNSSCFASFTIEIENEGKVEKYGEYLTFIDREDYIQVLRNLVRMKHNFLRVLGENL